MKKQLKKIISLVLVLSMVLSISIPGFAAVNVKPQINQSNDIVTEFKNYLEIYKQNYQNNLDANELLISFYAERQHKNYSFKEISSDKQTIIINDKQEIIFCDQNVFIATRDQIPLNNNMLKRNEFNSVGGSNRTSSSWNYTDTYRVSIEAYGAVFGNWLFTVNQEAQFRYNYSTSECIDSNGYYEFSNMNIWQVNDWQDSKITHPHTNGVNWTSVKSQGHFHYGFEVNGVGLVIKNTIAWATIECDPSGTVNTYKGII